MFIGKSKENKYINIESNFEFLKRCDFDVNEVALFFFFLLFNYFVCLYEKTFW